MKLKSLFVPTGILWVPPQIILIMKLTILMIFLAMLQCSAAVFGQKINLNETNTPLKKVLKVINDQTGYVFFYESKAIRNKNITIKIEDASLDAALTACLKNQKLSYEILNNTIFIKEQQATVQTPAAANSQQVAIKVTGRVVDEKSQALPGVTVKLKGGNAVVVTDKDGKFSIDVPNGDAVLVFSFIGYATREISAKQNLNNVQLTPTSSDLNQVVVVGYGTQKKVDLTGSVATVNGAVLNQRSTPNAANLLSGTIAGLDAVQSTGQPGKDAPNLQIRGMGSFGAGSAPLILVDGIIVTSLNSIAGNDIESVSVLKDAASASIYGNRAANGVILITTKRGKPGTTTINYNTDLSINQAIGLPDLIWNSAEYMTLFNQAREHNGTNSTPVYTQAQIDAYKNAPANSAQYPNYNYIDHYIKNAFSQNHHVSISGGSENTTFNIGAGYLQQNGTVKGTDAKRYNLLVTLDSKINKTFKVGGTVALSKQDITEPVLGNDGLILLIYGAGPTYAPYLTDGSGRIAKTDYSNNNAGHNRSIEYVLNSGSRVTNNYEARAQTYLEANITKGLTWLVKGAFNYNDQFLNINQFAVNQYAFQPDASGNYTVLDNGSPTSLGVFNQDTRQLYANAYSTLNYKTTIATDHHLNVLGGFSVESYTQQYLSGQRTSFPNNQLTQLNAGSVTGQSLNGDQYQYALESFFGQINYDYKGKYLLQLDGRNDGTSRISPSKRWGFFPAASIGWRLSEENFMKPLTWIDNLKIRASYGRLGNQNIGYYPYQALLNVTQYSFTSSGPVQGVNQQNLNNPDIQWEKTDNTDIGFDLSIKQGLFTATADYYNKKTSGILFTPNVLAAVGLNAPVTNAGTVQNRGFELDLGHANHIGKDFRYSVNAIFSLNRNKVLYLANGTQDQGMYINKVGLPYGSFYMLKWTGIYNSQDEINNSPKEAFASPKPGDLKFADTNGDNKIDANDRQIIKGAFPDYTYSFRVNFGYKNWDLSTFWQGVQGVKHYVQGWGIDPFRQGGAPPTFFRNAWTPENHSQTVPAIFDYNGNSGYAPNTSQNSTYYLKDASFLRLKNVRLTYHLVPDLAKRLLMKNASVFISADNLFTFTKFPGDPERLQTGPVSQSGSGTYGATNNYAAYPQIRMFTAGLNVTF